MTEHDLFLAALDISDATERANYLQLVCTDNPALLQRVEKLLEIHARCGDFLNIPALEQMFAGGYPNQVPDTQTNINPLPEQGAFDLSFLQTSPVPGSLGRLGHYEIHAVLGQGGCGIVLKAFDELLQRVVAIKVMSPH